MKAKKASDMLQYSTNIIVFRRFVMIFEICIKKLLRTPIKSFLFFLLLTVCGILLSLGGSLLITAKDIAKKVNDEFTTIAVPNVIKIRTDSGGDHAWVIDGKITRGKDN